MYNLTCVLQECLSKLNDIESDLDSILKRELGGIDEIFECIEHCSQDTLVLKNKLEELDGLLDPTPDITPDDIDGGLWYYR